METIKHVLSLNRDDNPKYYSLVEENNSLQSKIYCINEKILQLKCPKVFLFRHKNKINSLSPNITEIQELVDKWVKSYNDFINKPCLIFSINEEKLLGFLHYMRLLEIMDLNINRLYETLIEDYIKIQERYSNQVNFVIAILSAMISLIGLLITILSIKR